MDYHRAVSTLHTLGIHHIALESGSEGVVLVVPEWGRVMGIWPHLRVESALWLDPDFLSSLVAGARREEWTDPGGDRLWLWPDREFIDRRTGSPPPALEPGSYVATVERGSCTLETRGDALAFTTGVRVGFRIERRIRTLGSEELAARWGSPSLRCAGYEESVGLEVAAGAPLVGLQGISRVRASGEVWIALSREPGPGVEAPRPSRSGYAVVHLGMGKRSVALPARQARPLLLHLEELDGGRALLAARQCSWGEAVGCGLGCFAAEGSPSAELVMRSPGVGGPTGRRRIGWRQELAAFVGRGLEARSFARWLVSRDIA